MIFGTNLLTESPMLVSFFACFRVSQKRNTKRSPNGMKLLRWFFLDQKTSRGLGVHVRKATRRPQGREARPPPLWAPRDSTDLFLPPIYSQISQNQPGEPRNHFSTTSTFYTREIPSRGLFRRPAWGGFDHGGLLHQHHCLSVEAWVVCHRPTGP